MVKRVADWLEKMSVAVMAVGIFQGVWYGIFLVSSCKKFFIYISSPQMERMPCHAVPAK